MGERISPFVCRDLARMFGFLVEWRSRQHQSGSSALFWLRSDTVKLFDWACVRSALRGILCCAVGTYEQGDPCVAPG
eukprot:1696090-Pyramimonas_sp.AAC.1